MDRIPPRWGRLTVLALGAVLLSWSVTACSSSPPERAYTVPDSLCGTKVSSGSLKPLLPTGKKISAQPTSAVNVERCRLQVDGETAFSSSVEKRSSDVSAQDAAKSALGVEPTDSVADNGRFVYAKTGAVGRVECSASAEAGRSLWVTARTTHPAGEKDMLAFIRAYADTVAGTDACAKL
ncbi:hypothetical protein ACIREE_21520 [Streptomyces sp. NPDC102467]|uniref:hypothetical protein n=1 Tax=Streptomyces sp. NPDC102467 TaxID=3366179 RepID=UPI0038277ABB